MIKSIPTFTLTLALIATPFTVSAFAGGCRSHNETISEFECLSTDKHCLEIEDKEKLKNIEA